MRVARRSSQPRELVRLSPLQFSFSISIVVILLGGAGLTGYYFGQKQALRRTAEADARPTAEFGEAASKPGSAGTQASVTFYSTLTKSRSDVASPPSPGSVLKKSKQVKKVKAAAPAPEADPGEESYLSGPVILQVASYRDPENASKLLQELSSAGYSGTVVKADLGERGIWYRVRIGPYPRGEKTERILKDLREKRNLKGYIVK